ncbi:carnitine dehydratase [Agromyces sp. CFH 90414]|uniref:Carnitine dehydratase n=1 Tax=Agromyces agglutinans TaxID=2662258 RepID=A0A6I2F7W4_9MICO|nr:CoA transferase [Agromyces agglutinans]MRG61585.1 carnitine dehydratase [Agromyces agglutinans]
MPGESAAGLVRRVWGELGRDPVALERLGPIPEAPLPARLDAGGLVAGAVAIASLAAAASDADRRPIALDGDRIATAVTSERWFALEGAPPSVWAPLSGFRRSADGWVRTHANYPHHEHALRRALHVAVDASPAEVDRAIAARTSAELVASVTAAGGLCVEVRAERPSEDAALRERPLVDLGGSGGTRRSGSGDAARPLAGLRVLDLTRVIAGPVATRTLALLGAEVLRVDGRAQPEIGWQHLDTGAGKRSTMLDLADGADRRRFGELLDGADAVALGYRPAGLERLGLSPDELVDRHPRLVVGAVSAWGFDGANADRRGFDSLVQAETGIAVLEGDADAPGALPAQVLDHATGYLLAAAVTSMLHGAAGGARVARLSLRRTAAELLGMPRTDAPLPQPALAAEAAASHLVEFTTPLGAVRVAKPALDTADGTSEWPAGPRPWGADRAEWMPVVADGR